MRGKKREEKSSEMGKLVENYFLMIYDVIK